MAGTTYLPRREADLVTWSNNFNARLTGTVGAYGLDPGQVTGYTALHTAWINSYNAAHAGPTRGPAATQTKNDAKDALINGANGIRQLVNIIQHDPATTNTDREDLLITVPDVEPTPVPVPSAAPMIEIVSAVSRNVQIRLWDTENPDNRGKPAGVDGAAVLTFLGPVPPAPEDTEAWTFRGVTGKTFVDVEFAPSVASGTTAWITAYWFNTRKESGPLAAPISTQIPGTLAMSA